MQLFEKRFLQNLEKFIFLSLARVFKPGRYGQILFDSLLPMSARISCYIQNDILYKSVRSDVSVRNDFM